MEVKKADQRDLPTKSEAKRKPSTVMAAATFVGDVKEEFKKITWTSPGEMRTYAKIVVAMTFCCGLGIYVIDLAIQATLGVISWFFHMIVG